jgi:hypothetical protein
MSMKSNLEILLTAFSLGPSRRYWASRYLAPQEPTSWRAHPQALFLPPPQEPHQPPIRSILTSTPYSALIRRPQQPVPALLPRLPVGAMFSQHAPSWAAC